MSDDTEAMPSRERWDEIAQHLREPFDPAEVDFRVQGKANEQTGRAQVVAYIDARVVQDRLDAVVGAGNWSFDWQPLNIDNKGEVTTAKGTLTIYGVSKADAGTASNFEQTLGAVSHCFKRAAVHWGIGRYLYNLPSAWVSVEKNGRIPDTTLHELRAKLPRPKQSQQQRVEQPQPRMATSDIAPDALNVHTRQQPQPQPQPQPQQQQRVLESVDDESEGQGATQAQLQSIVKLCNTLGKPVPVVQGLEHAKQIIKELSEAYREQQRAKRGA